MARAEHLSVGQQMPVAEDAACRTVRGNVGVDAEPDPVTAKARFVVGEVTHAVDQRAGGGGNLRRCRGLAAGRDARRFTGGHHGGRGDERVPLADASFDLVISEYGASIWCDPYRWVPEAARLLRPRGRLVFLRNSTLLMLCVPDVGAAGDRLLRPQAGLHRMSWQSDPGVEFHLGHGDWLRLLRTSGFEVEDLVELYAPDDAASAALDFVTVQWARQWPVEEVWFASRQR
jgi:SAM-dependent methyltransferase